MARALRATGGDPARARELAIGARDLLAPLATRYGSYYEASRRDIDAWLAAK